MLTKKKNHCINPIDSTKNIGKMEHLDEVLFNHL